MSSILYLFLWSEKVAWSKEIKNKLEKTDVECICADSEEVREIISKKVKKIPAIVVCEWKNGKKEIYVEENKGRIEHILF